ncbi:MAG: hypothetical protein ACI8XO_000895 [Verrucomicrobiales bacterium]|jgi:hypothetical protein
MEPSSQVGRGPGVGAPSMRGFYNHATERLRILDEIPLRKRDVKGQPIFDPDGNEDTSFLTKIPADTPFTFQTLDKDGLVLNMSQTWHQVRPGEKRANCGGCHAHSQIPLAFDLTFAARPEYTITDLTKSTPLLSKNTQGSSDYYTGLDRSSLSVTADFKVDGRAPGTELGLAFKETGDHVWELDLGTDPIGQLSRGNITVSIKDESGNITTINRTFSVGAPIDPKLQPSKTTLNLTGEPPASPRDPKFYRPEILEPLPPDPGFRWPTNPHRSRSPECPKTLLSSPADRRLIRRPHKRL